MSSFQVLPGAVADTSSRLASISGHVAEVHGRLEGCSGAAAGTPAAGAVESLLARWGAALPRFARSAESLTRAVAAAAQDYTATDGAVGDAAAGEGAT